MSLKPREVFQQNLEKYQNQAKHLQSRSTILAIVRFAAFLGLGVGAWFFFTERNAVLVSISLLLLIIVFFLLVRRHNRVKEKLRITNNLMAINRRELLLLDHNPENIDGGSDFINASHHYSSDLDLFGQNSLFTYLNRTASESGRQILARWLLQAADSKTIISRQQAIEEVSPDHAGRQYFEALGTASKNQAEDVVAWLQKPIPKMTGWLQVSKYLVPFFTFAAAVYVFGFSGSFYFLLLPYILGIASLRVTQKQIEEVHTDTKKHTETLDSVRKLLEAIEQSEFESKFLQKQKQKLLKSNSSIEITKIHKSLDAFNGRANVFYHLLNAFLLLDVYILDRFRSWQVRNSPVIEDWFDALAKTDAVFSLAGFHFVQERATFPELIDSTDTLEVKEIFHPLIPAETGVGNSFKITSPQQLALVTGSNMSGKSTFLRTLGINLVLAYTGSAVLAEAMKVGRFQIFTSMRIVDDLNQNMSSFYAELARIKQLIEILDTDLPVFYLLDEILLGTNSNDRHKGSVALIGQLLSSKSTGLIATHDLQLGELAMEDKRIVNYCFTSEVRDEKLHFDYKIKDGIGYNFNATELMKKMGLDIKNP